MTSQRSFLTMNVCTMQSRGALFLHNGSQRRSFQPSAEYATGIGLIMALAFNKLFLVPFWFCSGPPKLKNSGDLQL